MTRPIRIVAMLLGLVVAAASGCSRGPKEYPVSGEVVVSGKPVSGAAVLLYREKAGRPPSGTTNASGQFRLSALAGDYTAVITACESLSKQVGMGLVGEDPSKVRWIVPEKYSRSDDSDLKVTVKPGGDNHFKFEFPRK